MKPVYRCEYCDHMGTEDEVRAHEKSVYIIMTVRVVGLVNIEILRV